MANLQEYRDSLSFDKIDSMMDGFVGNKQADPRDITPASLLSEKVQQRQQSNAPSLRDEMKAMNEKHADSVADPYGGGE